MAFSILGTPKPAFFDSNGSPLASGTLSVLEPADNSNKTYYPTADDADAGTNGASGDITLDSRGETPNAFFGVNGEDYKLVLKDSTGTTIWTVDDVYAGAGANRVSYNQGGTGAVDTTVQSKLREIVSVKDFGAVGDGVTDDATALQAALDSFTGRGTLFFPSGDYRSSQMLTIPNMVSIVGMGGRSSRVEWTEDVSGFYFAAGAGGMSISGMNLVGNYVATNADYNGILTNGAGANSYISIHDNIIEDWGGNGIESTVSNVELNIANNIVENCRVGISLFKGNSRCRVTGNSFLQNRLNGLQVDDATTGDTALTSAPNSHAIVSNNVFFGNCTDSGASASVVWSGSTNGIISDNIIKNTGVIDSVAAWGIIVNSGQDDFNVSKYVNVSNNVIEGCAGAGAIKLEGVQGASVHGNLCTANWKWSTGLSNAAEIDIVDDGTNTSTVISIGNNICWDPGGVSSESDIGIRIAPAITNVKIGDNMIINIVTDVDNNATSWQWTGMTRGVKPSWDAGYEGRLFYDTADDILYLADNAAWVKTAIAASQTYTPTNVVTDRSYDADATTVTELADVLGTLIADLQARGVIL